MAMNTMLQQHAAQQAALGGMRKAALSLMHAALSKGYRKLKAGGAHYAKLKAAGRSFLFRHRRKAWNGWEDFIAEKARKLAAMQDAAKSFANRAILQGWNGWMASVRASSLEPFSAPLEPRSVSLPPSRFVHVPPDGGSRSRF